MAIDRPEAGELGLVGGIYPREICEASGSASGVARAGTPRSRSAAATAATSAGARYAAFSSPTRRDQLMLEAATRPAQDLRGPRPLERARQHDGRELAVEHPPGHAQVRRQRLGQLGKRRDPVPDETAVAARALAEHARGLQGRRVDVDRAGVQLPDLSRTHSAA